MRILKSFEEFIKEGVVKKVAVDKERAKSLILESERKMRSLHEQVEKIGVKKDNANNYVEYCYDSMMNVLRATLFLKGYSASGNGAHEAEVSYLRLLEFDEKVVQFANQVRYFRNGILYYGTTFDEEYAHTVIEFTKKLHSRIRILLKSCTSANASNMRLYSKPQWFRSPMIRTHSSSRIFEATLASSFAGRLLQIHRKRSIVSRFFPTEASNESMKSTTFEGTFSVILTK